MFVRIFSRPESSFNLTEIIAHACENDLFVKVDPDKLEVEEVNI